MATFQYAIPCHCLGGTFATDKLFSSESAHDSMQMVQIFVGKMSLLAEIISMQQELQFTEALKAFLVKWGHARYAPQ